MWIKIPKSHISSLISYCLQKCSKAAALLTKSFLVCPGRIMTGPILDWNGTLSFDSPPLSDLKAGRKKAGVC